MSNVYFDNFPKIHYRLNNNDEWVTLKHILPRFRIIDIVQNNSGNYHPYRIQDGDTLESISYKAYGDERWYWVIAIYNNIIDPYEDMPLTSDNILTLVQTRYGASNINSVHHYIDDLGNEVQTQFSAIALPITNYDYEYNLNEARRLIRIPHPDALPLIQKQLETVMLGL